MKIRLIYTQRSTLKLLQTQLQPPTQAQKLMQLLLQRVKLHPTLPRTPEEMSLLRALFLEEFGKLPEHLLSELILRSPVRESGTWAGVLLSEAFRLASPAQIATVCSLSSRPMNLLVETYKLLSNYAARSATTEKPSETTAKPSSTLRQKSQKIQPPLDPTALQIAFGSSEK